MSNKFWPCDHVKTYPYGYTIQGFQVGSDWNVCPVGACGAIRPTAPKKLGEKLREEYSRVHPRDHYSNWDAVALCAIEEVENVIHQLGWSGESMVELKQALRGML